MHCWDLCSFLAVGQSIDGTKALALEFSERPKLKGMAFSESNNLPPAKEYPVAFILYSILLIRVWLWVGHFSSLVSLFPEL